MVRQLAINIPDEVRGELVPEDIHELLVRIPQAHHVCSFKAGGSTMVRCSVANKHASGIIARLERLGVGAAASSSWIDVIELKTSIPRYNREQVGRPVRPPGLVGKLFGNRAFRVSDRITTEEIYETVDTGLHLTFDYLAMIVCAAVICATGLLGDSPVTVVSSMLLSPLMGPILATCLGTVLMDRTMLWKGFRNEIVGVVLTFVLGFTCGAVQSLVSGEEVDSEQINSRGNLEALYVGMLIAAPSGIALALSVTGESAGGLVGVAIATAILPPITNSGLNIALAVFSDNQDYKDHTTSVAKFSFLLFLLNWLMIFVFSILTFKIKDIAPTKRARTHSGYVESPGADLEANLDTPVAFALDQQSLLPQQEEDAVLRHDREMLQAIHSRNRQSRAASGGPHEGEGEGEGEGGKHDQGQGQGTGHV